MKRFGFQILLIFASLSLWACEYTVEKSVDPTLTSASKPMPHLNFAQVDEQVFRPKCVQCHSNAEKNSGGVNLENFENIVAALKEINQDIRSGEMPRAPMAPLTREEKTMLLSWIQMGAPKDSPEPPPPENPQPTPSPTPVVHDLPTPGLEPKFTSIYNLIIKVKCLECHQEGGDAELFPFEKYSDIVFGKMVIPNDPDNSILPKHLIPGIKKIMPPVTSKYKILADEDVNIIKDWIRQGAPNN